MEGALIGAALGVAAGIFADSKAGKKFGKEVVRNVKKESADFYKYMAPKISKAKKMSDSEYKVFVKDAIKAYGKGKKMSAKDAANLLKESQSLWARLKKGSKPSKVVKSVKAKKPAKRSKVNKKSKKK